MDFFEQGLETSVTKSTNVLSNYYAGDDLGLNFSRDESTFKLWAPQAKAVGLVLYDNAGVYNDVGKVDDHTDGKEFPMQLSKDGVWEITLPENLSGLYYMFKVTLAEPYSDSKLSPFLKSSVNYVIDPYAKAVSTNGQRGYVLDLSETNPDNWKSKQKAKLQSKTDAIIYEMNIRDFSISPDSGMKNKGKFLALTEENTKLCDSEISTGLTHLLELGVTHIQLMPIFDYQTVDERTYSADNYNWGYDPQNYNVPEGSYALETENPASRIKELKQTIQKLHDLGLRVIMDVVYNHTYSITDGPFEKIAPGYFYRQDKKGNYTNGSGTGSEIASERPMVKKFILDSLKYWVKEYDIDGFRFDLMGLIDIDTMDEISRELHILDPNILILGEPWQAGGSPLVESKQTLKGSQKGKNFAVFNDRFRNAIKGGSDDATKGFATGAPNKETLIARGIEGSYMDFTVSPSESINYVIAHDNLNLWDKVLKTQELDNEEEIFREDPYAILKTENDTEKHGVFASELVRRSLLANTLVLLSQGIPFIHSGDEFLRSKFGDFNSYRSTDSINMLRWENKHKFMQVFEYYKGVIALRKAHPAFRMNDVKTIREHLKFLQAKDRVVAFTLQNFANGDSWREIVIIFNANKVPIDFNLPHKDSWKIIVKDGFAGTEVIEIINNDKVIVEELSTMVLYIE